MLQNFNPLISSEGRQFPIRFCFNLLHLYATIIRSVIDSIPDRGCLDNIAINLAVTRFQVGYMQRGYTCGAASLRRVLAAPARNGTRGTYLDSPGWIDGSTGEYTDYK